MPRVIEIVGIIDDGAPTVRLQPPVLPPPVQAEYGENVTIHLLLFNPSGHQVFATTDKVVTYGARAQPLPFGVLLFQHIATISPTGDGGWDLPIVPHDYVNIQNGAGRFTFSIWLTDNTVFPPQSVPVTPLGPFIVTPTAISVDGPSTAPIPQQIIAYGLPTPGASGTFLESLGATAGIGVLRWARPAGGGGGLPDPTGFPGGSVPVVRNDSWVYNTRLNSADVDGIPVIAFYDSENQTWDDIYTQISAAPGGAAIVLVGDTLVIPPGSWETSRVLWRANGDGIASAGVTVSDGAILTASSTLNINVAGIGLQFTANGKIANDGTAIAIQIGDGAAVSILGTVVSDSPSVSMIAAAGGQFYPGDFSAPTPPPAFALASDGVGFFQLSAGGIMALLASKVCTGGSTVILSIDSPSSTQIEFASGATLQNLSADTAITLPVGSNTGGPVIVAIATQPIENQVYVACVPGTDSGYVTYDASTMDPSYIIGVSMCSALATGDAFLLLSATGFVALLKVDAAGTATAAQLLYHSETIQGRVSIAQGSNGYIAGRTQIATGGGLSALIRI